MGNPFLGDSQSNKGNIRITQIPVFPIPEKLRDLLGKDKYGTIFYTYCVQIFFML